MIYWTALKILLHSHDLRKHIATKVFIAKLTWNFLRSIFLFHSKTTTFLERDGAQIDKKVSCLSWERIESWEEMIKFTSIPFILRNGDHIDKKISICKGVGIETKYQVYPRERTIWRKEAVKYSKWSKCS